MSMPRSKLEAFYQEFPWLETLVRKCPSLMINVQRIDLELFKRKRESEDVGLFFTETVYEKLYALDATGKPVGMVGYEILLREKGFWAGFKPTVRFIRGDTLEGLFYRLGIDAPLVEFVVSINKESVTIYKAPKNMTILAYIHNEIQKAQEEIRTQLEEINKE